MNLSDLNLKLMKEAVAVSVENLAMGGGPFGAVIAKNGEILARVGNSVTLDNDPTAHAEVNAIRLAARKLKTFDLSDCEIYCSSEPCPMCFGAIYWAKIGVVYFANGKDVASRYGFDDGFIYDEIVKTADERKKLFVKIEGVGEMEVFEIWNKKIDKIEY